jgi:hypothetical protein
MLKIFNLLHFCKEFFFWKQNIAIIRKIQVFENAKSQIEFKLFERQTVLC